jgi:hypothetical protein
MQEIQRAGAELAEYREGDRDSKAKIKRLMGEFKAISAFVDVELEHGDGKSRTSDDDMPLFVKKGRIRQLVVCGYVHARKSLGGCAGTVQ